MSTDRRHPEGLLGKKVGMTQFFTEDGRCVPVTAIEVGPCYIIQVKTEEKDGYKAVQLGFEPRKAQRVSAPITGHFTKAGSGCFNHLGEIRCDAEALGWTEAGKELKVADVFTDGDLVDVSGVSKGRGFAGVVKRFRVAGQPASRGTHESFRNIGSIGCNKFPSRVFKNKKMPGRMGGRDVTTQNLKVVGVRPQDNVLLVEGGIPGAQGGLVVIRKARKGVKSSQAAA